MRSRSFTRVKRLIASAIVVGCTHGAQRVSTAPAGTGADPFAPLEGSVWPAPNRFRAETGAPGPEYWQQRADYRVVASLDTSAKRINGSVQIRYTNNSPDTLRALWIQLDQNLYRRGSAGQRRFGRASRWSGSSRRGFVGGYRISGLTVDGRVDSSYVDDTNLRIELSTPLAPRGGIVTVRMDYNFDVPGRGSDRLAHDGTLYEIAQWYPRMAVYDDLRGWNTDRYLGQAEFYLDYGDVAYEVTLPAGFLLAGTGTLSNPDAVLTPRQRERLALAAKSDSVIQIITPDEATAAAAIRVPGTRTWRMRAEQVRDVAWVAAPDLRWDAVNANGALAQALYRRHSSRAWEHAAEQVRRSLFLYSRLWIPYPYPQATVVAGVVWGMEYPMLAMVHDDEMLESPLIAIDHEIAHQWFPMIVGSNERRHAWQDEGLATLGNAFMTERERPAEDVMLRYLESWRDLAHLSRQPSLMTPGDDIDPDAYGALAYNKPAAVLLALRDDVVGREAMDRAMRAYATRWAFRHPSPVDFFRTVQNVAGQDLQWFWRAFFYGTDVLDIGLDRVVTRTRDGQRVAELELTRHSRVPFPVTVRLALAGGRTQDVRLPVAMWSECATTSASCSRSTASVAVSDDVVGARLWPDGASIDWDESNDSWGRAPAKTRRVPVTSGGLAPSSQARP